jgi:2-polyprenyl-6-hydroxyphenyl methylase/3-demethylubiquinone-9 3-methyltransferase
MSRESHFEFGENWLSFVDVVSEERIAGAVEGLERLFPDGELRGKRFLDIGCGSGLSMLAALRLGSAEVRGVDIDENSVKASRRCLAQFSGESKSEVFRSSVFDLDPNDLGRFDVVHSWGVLHHTGDMWRARQSAVAMLDDHGILAISLYKKTPFCGIWRVEKRLYSRSPAFIQGAVRRTYLLARTGRELFAGRNPWTRGGSSKPARGMSASHDTHDWLGGYPYESASPEEVRTKLARLGLSIVHENITLSGRLPGVFGTACDEYVARR